MNKTQMFLKRHSSTILTVFSAAGVVGTTILAVKATPKALKLLEKARTDKGEDLTIAETIKVAWKPYVPTAFVGFSTIACIFGANYLNARNQASLMSAYALLDNAYKEYKTQVEDTYGKDISDKLEHEVIKAKYDEGLGFTDDALLFFDYQSMRFFESTMQAVLHAENVFLESYNSRGYAFLNEYYDILGVPRVNYGYQLGWHCVLEDNSPYNCRELTFDYEEITVGDGRPCWIINPSMPPTFDYIL